MTIGDQVERLVELGVPALAGLEPSAFRRVAAPAVQDANERSIVVVHPNLVPPHALAPLLRRGPQRGFVVQDMTDLDAFVPIEQVRLPTEPVYAVTGVDRGDDLLNWSPDEALPEITARDRTPLTISEGICWLLQQPDQLQPNACFMCVGSRKRGPRGLDARTPAIWISGGTGRDGRERRGAPKVGWCWAGNRHTWLGFASASTRG